MFAWLMSIQNLLDVKSDISYRDRGSALETMFASSYPDSCRECGKRICECPAVLPSTIGRIGHEDPAMGGFDAEGRFMSPDERQRAFSS